MTTVDDGLVTLVHDYQYGGWGARTSEVRALNIAPRFVRGESRWHRPRSGRLYGDRPCLSLWCGQSVTDLRDRPTAGSEADLDGVPICGTCEGRYLGHLASDDRLVFSPTACKPPSTCPSSRGTDLVRETAWNRAVCLVCGEAVKLRSSGGVFGTWGAQVHRPGPGLIPAPCTVHGWHRLTVAAGDVICECEALRDRP